MTSKQALGLTMNELAEANAEHVTTISKLEQKLTDIAVQLANADSKCRELSSKAMELVCEASLVYSKYNDTQMPDRDLVDMQTLQEMHDLCKGAAL